MPIWAGVRVGPDLDTLTLATHLATLKTWGFRGVLFEGTLKAPTDSLAVEPGQTAALLTSGRVAQRVGLPHGFALSATHPDSVVGFGLAARRQHTYLWAKLLNANPRHPPALAVAGLNFGAKAKQARVYLAHPTLFLHAQPADSLAPDPYSPCLAIAATGALDGDHKAYARQWHTQASALARQSGQPVFLAQTNLLGEDRLLQLKNHLRFWPKRVALQGVVLNTLYPTPSVLDSTSQFGLAHDREFIAWLRAYLRRP